MATSFERVKAAWDSPGRPVALHRVVEAMASEGVTRAELDDALGRLLDEVRAAGADDDTEEVINAVGDRLHGWCHVSGHIRFPAETTQTATVRTPGASDPVGDARV